MFGASKSGSAALPSDPDFEYVTLLLDGNGTNGGQNNTFLDSSTNNFTITRNGNTTQGSFSPYGDLWSNYLDGSSYLTVANNSALQFGTGNFTVEGWYYLPSTSQNNSSFFSIGRFDAGILLRYQLTGSDSFYINNTSYDWSPVANFPLNQWNHIAVVRNGSAVNIYVNGTSVFSTTNSANISQSTDTNLGKATHGTDENLTGYISNFRINKGTAVYTASFTPSTTPLTAISGTSLLTCQSNRFIDNSSNAFSITLTGSPSVQRFSPFEPSAPYSTSVIGGSGYFDGSGDYLSVASNAAFGYGTGDFEISFWFYKTNSGDAFLIDQRTTDTQAAVCLYITSSTVRLYVSGADRITSSSISLNTWYYLTVSRVSGTTKMFLNGSQTGSDYSDSTNYVNSPVIIGIRAIDLSSSPLQGYMSNVRIIKGSGVTSQTVATSPLTAITNTQLLCNFTNASIFDYAMMNNLETVGNAQVSTSVKKFGTGSLAFDGNGDYLLLPNSKPLTIYSSSPFTIEFWVYFNSVSAQQYMLSNWTIGADGYAIATGVSTFANNQIAFFDGTSWRGGSTTVTTGTWYHFAVSSSGASSGTYIYLNGTSQVSGFTCAGTIDNAATQMFIGLAGSGATSFLNGYIDDLRITNGVNRYPSGTTFTPPTVAFPIY